MRFPAGSALRVLPALAAFASAQTTSRTTEAEEALITDPTEECTDYDYAPVAAIKDFYPTLWVTANLENSGISAYDKALFAAMNSSIPDIAPKGTRAGNFTDVVYNSTDPDCWWSWSKCDAPKLAGLPDDITRCDEPNTWGFTLDDGPNCSHNSYYDYLASIEQKATLFYIGSNVLDWPLEGQRGLADGHEICAHTWSHPYMTAMTNEEAFSELYFSQKILKEVLGITVKCWRPPYGDVDDRIRWIANALDMVTIVWEEDTFDWEYSEVGIAAVQANYQNVLDLQANGTFSNQGTIVLTHELDNETMSLSEDYLPTIIQQFTGGVMPIAVCMNNTQPYVEGASYRYPNYAEWAAGTRTISLLAPTALSVNVNLTFTSGGAGTPTATGPVSATGTLSTSFISSMATAVTSSGSNQSSAAASASQADDTTAGTTTVSNGAGAAWGTMGAGVFAFAVALFCF